MHIRKLLASGYWREVGKKSKAAKIRRAAIAFVTEDLVGFSKGDVLVANVSLPAIRSGGTSAGLLLGLYDKGVAVYNCPDLHAKVLLLGDVAVIGSGNMSDKSNRPSGGWQEAGLITNDVVAVAGVASFVEQLARPAALLTRKRLVALSKIEVTRRGGWNSKNAQKRRKVSRLGNRTWISGLREVSFSQAEQTKADGAVQTFGDDTESMRYSVSSRFAKEVRPGDSVIVIWKPRKNSRARVYQSSPVLRKEHVERQVLIHYRETRTKYAEITWSKFQKLLKKVGYSRDVKPGSTQLVPIEVADALAKCWNAIAKA